MAIYRALTNLEKGETIINEGCAFSGRGFAPETIERLLELERICAVSVPPLMEIPGWQGRAKVLAKHDIMTLDAFCEADPVDIAKILKVKPGIARDMQYQLLDFASLPKRKRKG